MEDRKYVTVSIKHSEHDKSNTPILWGYKRTADNVSCIRSKIFKSIMAMGLSNAMSP